MNSIPAYALLIGVSENQVARLALPAVAQDVAALHAVLSHPQRCAYEPEHVQTLVGPNARCDSILDGLAWLKRALAANPQASALIYYSGHGWRTPAGEYYLLPYDLQEGRTRYSALRAADFTAEISAMQPERLLVILDCCHAGGMGVKGLPQTETEFTSTALPPGILMENQPGFDPGVKGLAELAVGRGRAVLSSSTGEQSSYLRPDRQLSLFTYHLIEGLTGHAAHPEGATEVLVSEVISHVHRAVPASAGRMGLQQQPDYQLNGNFPVARLLGGQGLTKGVLPPDPLSLALAATASTQIYTGGGPYIGTLHGDYIGGDQHVQDRRIQVKAPLSNSTLNTGDHNQFTQTASTNAAPSLADFLNELAALRQQLTRLNLPQAEQSELQTDLDRVEELAGAPQPNRNLLLKRLQSVMEFLANTVTVAGAAPGIAEMGRRLLEWADKLF